MNAEPTRPLPEWSSASPSSGAPAPAGKRRRRRPRITWIIVVVVLVLLVVSDFAARAYTENQMASQVQSSLGLSGKPKVTIHGFPFWTQLIARDFKTVTVTANNETINVSNAASGVLQISSLNATLDGMHIHGLNSATIDHFTATALVTFTALGNVGGIPSGVTLVPDGPNQIKATVSLFGLFSDSATVQVTQSGPNQINVKVTDFGGIPASALGNLGNFNITIPKLPAGVTIQSVSVTQQGLQITVSGQNTTLSQ
jgi:LmeA-like phospholipid-binding